VLTLGDRSGICVSYAPWRSCRNRGLERPYSALEVEAISAVLTTHLKLAVAADPPMDQPRTVLHEKSQQRGTTSGRHAIEPPFKLRFPPRNALALRLRRRIKIP
jgi:hypothetical protein